MGLNNEEGRSSFDTSLGKNQMQKYSSFSPNPLEEFAQEFRVQI
jgi:hypothetical protein